MKRHFLIIPILLLTLLLSCKNEIKEPTGVIFNYETLKRVGNHGDNWCITWTNDDNQITSMCDGDWTGEMVDSYFHNHLYKIIDKADSFNIENIGGYPSFFGGDKYAGWYGYGIVAIDSTIYSMVSLTPGLNWSGPFRGVKMLKSANNGKTWQVINYKGEEKIIEPDSDSGFLSTPDEMFFMEEFGRVNHEQIAYPFSWVSFVQNGKAGSASKDNYIYIYAPESSNSHELLLARVDKNKIDVRSNWEYFNKWEGENIIWTKDINERKPAHVFPEKNSNNEYFGWYSWLPSVVWNEGLGLYIMVNGGTYAGRGMTNSEEDYYDRWMHTKTGSLGLWYSKNPYGPWKQFYYTDYWEIHNENNLNYQPKLSPKWISNDGKEMTLIWSDAMRNSKGASHDTTYRWNQMDITLTLK